MISVKDEGSGLVSFANHSHFCGEIPLGSLNAGKCYSGWNIVFVVLKKREAPHIIFEAFKAFISKANKFELPKKKKKKALGAECFYSSCRLHDIIRRVLLQMFPY